MSMGMRRGQLRDLARLLSTMDPEEQRARIARLGPEELLMLDTAFEAWAHEAQLPPAKDGWRTWLMMAGRGFGKTRAGAEWVHELAWSRPVRIALVAATIDEARRVMVEGASGVLSVARRFRHKLKWEPSKGELTWPRGSVAQLYSGDNADGLRGPEHGFAWCAATRGRACGRLRRGAAASSPSCCAHRGAMFYRRQRSNGRMGGVCRPRGCLHHGGWRYIPPVNGMCFYVRSEQASACYRAGQWELGVLRGSSVVIGADQVLGLRSAAIADPTGGTVADAEARAAIAAMIAALRAHGLISP
jgi:hypothetical protein